MASTTAAKIALTRRRFLGGAAGLTFAVGVGTKGAWFVTAAAADSRPLTVGAWVRIAPDDSITIVTPAAEMGQGSMTGVPVALAEELDADWSRVTLEMASAEPEIYGYSSWGGRRSMGIYGSRAVMMYFDQMRLAGAQVRKVLLEAAAKRWNVDSASLETEPGVVVHRPSNRRLSYGEIAAFAKVPSAMPVVTEVDLKPKSAFRLIGKAVPRHDIPAKVNGSARYSMDVRVPGMVYASTLHSPVQQGRPKHWNDAAVRAMAGVVDVVALDHGVAVVARTFEQVLAARKALVVTWADAPAEGYDSETALMSAYEAIASDTSAAVETVGKKGDAGAAFAGAARVYKASFRSDYGYHAQMEPLNAVARFDKAAGTLEVWEGTQAPGASAGVFPVGMPAVDDPLVEHHGHRGAGRRHRECRREGRGDAGGFDGVNQRIGGGRGACGEGGTRGKPDSGCPYTKAVRTPHGFLRPVRAALIP